MSGRFGKYGDIKRKAKIRRSKIAPKDLDKLKNVPRKNRKPRPAPK
jgi:hypothetical protein